MFKPLTGQTVLVTGGAIRLGRALTLGLATAGADVVIHYAHSAEAAEETLADVRRLGVRGAIVQGDFLGDPSVTSRDVIQRSNQQLGPLTMLVNSAAIFEAQSLDELTADAWGRHLSINLTLPTFLCQEFDRQLAANAEGQIINIVDWRGLRPGPGHLAYTVAKSGLIALTKLLAQELAPRVRVNAIAPGAILPPPGLGPEYLDGIAHRIPLQRHGGPDDITAAMLYLATASFVTGEVLTVAGGEGL